MDVAHSLQWRPCEPGLPRTPAEPTAAQQLDALLEDAEFSRLIDYATAEVMRIWNVPRSTAAGFVISAIGEPKALARIHQEWFAARAQGTSFGLAKLIVRRRVCDLLRSDARRPQHDSLPGGTEDFDDVLGSLCDRSERDPHAQAELNQVMNLVRIALRSFAEQGPIQARQAQLVRYHALDEVTYAELAPKLSCTQRALRVRVHKAMRALRKHIESCHPELEDLLGRTLAGSRRS